MASFEESIQKITEKINIIQKDLYNKNEEKKMIEEKTGILLKISNKDIMDDKKAYYNFSVEASDYIFLQLELYDGYIIEIEKILGYLKYYLNIISSIHFELNSKKWILILLNYILIL